MTNIEKEIISLGINAKKASLEMRLCKTNEKNQALNNLIKNLNLNREHILNANLIDLENGRKKLLSNPIINRLTLKNDSIDNLIKSIEDIILIPDPIGVLLEEWERPNGLKFNKISTPLGVLGVIYESRPNVTVDASCLSIKSGNSIILRGGSESLNSNKILVKLFRKALTINRVNPDYIQLIDKKGRNYVNFMLEGMTKYLDVIIPRGGKGLVEKVKNYSKVPTIGHLEGLCHTYIDKDAELKMATNIVYNAKLRNTSICGATETILMHKKIVKKFCNPIINKLEENNCKIIGDKFLKKFYKGKILIAKEKDWSTEYLDSIVSVKCVNGLDDAINHINKYGTMHTDSIITKNKISANKFLKNIKSSIAIHNSSTQFADGGEFGFGGEVGISTNKLPPRGPVGLEQLVSYKYEILGKGQTRK